MAKFDELEIQHFRGAAGNLKLSFSKQHALVVIYGENGSGKTTIVDAMDLVGNAYIGSIKEKSSTVISTHAPTLGKTAADIRVTARWKEQVWIGTLKSNKVTVDPPQGLPVHVLRSKNLQQFVDAVPSARFQEIRHLIGVDHIEKSEKALSDAATRTSNDADNHVRERGTAEAILKGIWEQSGTPDDNAESWARRHVREFGEAYASREAALRTIQSALGTLSNMAAALIEADQEWQRCRTSADDFVASSRQDAATEGAHATELMRVLSGVEQFLSSMSQSTACPVCEQPIVLEQLRESVSKRLAALEHVRKRDEHQGRLSAAAVTAEHHLDRVATRCVEAARHIVSLATGDLYGAELLDSVAGMVVNRLDDALEVSARTQFLHEHIERQRQDAAELKGQIASLAQALETMDAATADAERTTRLAAALKRAAAIVRYQRHSWTQDLLNSVADDANRLYARIHPGERLAISRLALDPKQRASLLQYAHFNGQEDVPPQAYFSEAHLDTLGFCFWLANVKRQRANQKAIVVIDDVFTSADAQHLHRIANLLVDEAGSFGQVVVTTHNAAFRELFKKFGRSQIISLDHRWSLGNGIRVANAVPPVEQLRAALKATNFDRQTIASKSGVLLEFLLDTIALQYQVRMKRVMPPEYTLGELVSDTRGCLEMLDVYGPDGVLKPAAIEPVRELDRLNFIRNQVGAHYNVSGEQVSNHDVERYGQLVIQIHDRLTCPSCGMMPDKREGSRFICRCKLTPTSFHMRQK